MQLVIGVLFITIGCDIMSLTIWPDRSCTRCGGTGRKPGSDRRRSGACKRCGGSGRQKRLGA